MPKGPNGQKRPGDVIGADAQLTPVRSKLSQAERAAILEEVRAQSAGKATPGPSAERSQDFLYDDDGLPA